jgi:hypothetical protein
MGKGKRSWQEPILNAEKDKLTQYSEKTRYSFFVSNKSNGSTLMTSLLNNRP